MTKKLQAQNHPNFLALKLVEQLHWQEQVAHLNWLVKKKKTWMQIQMLKDQTCLVMMPLTEAAHDHQVMVTPTQAVHQHHLPLPRAVCQLRIEIVHQPQISQRCPDFLQPTQVAGRYHPDQLCIDPSEGPINPGQELLLAAAG